ncbi:MAG: arginine--tRNA ligase [Candidatus Paceibacterota bacterium]
MENSVLLTHMIRDILENAIKTALWELQIEESKIPKINLEHPEDISHGDYSSNIAMILAKAVAENPREFAEKIKAEILERKPAEIEKIEVADPGFINFYLSKNFFTDSVKEILKSGEKFGKNKDLRSQKIVVEYTDPNPFKEFHIGHLMSNSIGEAVSRIIEANGANVKRACYQGDVGLHVAKAIYGIIVLQPDIDKLFSDKKYSASSLGEAYVYGAEAYEGDLAAKADILKINKNIYDGSDPLANKVYKWGRKISLEYFEDIYKILGTSFDNKFFESETGPFGKEIVEKNIGKVFEKSDGAIIFRGENYGLHTRVFINKEGLPTYEAKELGLAKIKYDKTKYDKSIVITGNEINEYFKVLLKAMSLVFPELAVKTVHLSHGMLRLPTGKMSSRTGQVVTAVSLIDKIKDTIKEKMKGREMSEKEREKVSEEVSVGALKYSILKQVTGKDIIFDFDKSISFEGDSGPYLQYSYARAKSVLRKAKDERISGNTKERGHEIFELEKMLYRFPEIVERAGKDYAPNHIATYLIQLASSFNGFYAKGKIVDKEDKNSSYKVALTEAFTVVLKNGLNLLGIKAPEKM